MVRVSIGYPYCFLKGYKDESVNGKTVGNERYGYALISKIHCSQF